MIGRLLAPSALLLTVACQPAASASSGDTTPGPRSSPVPVAEHGQQNASGAVRVLGTVRVVGSAPVNTETVVETTDRGTLRVTGPLAAEVARLAGVQVELEGTARGREIAVAGYSIRSIDGRPGELGVVERAGDGGLQLRRADGSVVRLAGATTELRPGQKVWVQGPTTVQVQSFGIVRP